MDVKLPDGTVIQGIPEGTSKADLVAKLSAKGYDTSWYKPEPVEQPKAATLGGSMEEVAKERPWETGIATAASKAVRGVGTTLLPKAAQAWAEKHGIIPTERDIELLKQGTAASGKAQAADIAGEIALTAVPGAQAYKGVTSLLPRTAGSIKRAIVGGSAAGAAGGAIMGEDPVTGATTGAALGPLAAGVGNVGGWAWRHGKRLFEAPEASAARYVQSLTETPAADAAVLRSLRGLVPGEQPTSGMAATVEPRMLYQKELQEQAARRLGGRAEAISQANEAARAAPLEAIAAPGQRGFDRATQQVLPSYAEEMRAAVTRPMYQRAAADRVRVDPNLERILSGAEVMPARAAGARQFSQEQTNFPGTRGFEPGSPGGQARDALGTPIGSPQPFTPATYSVEELQLVRRNLDDRINQAAQQGDNVAVRRLSEARRQLSGEMTGQSGNFALGNTMFRNLSAPQNQADVAQVLLNALRSPTGKERASSFLTARRNAPLTLKRADQSPRFTHEGEILSPEQLRNVEAVTSSLRRQSTYENLPRMELPGIMSPAEAIEGSLPSMIDRGMTIVKKGLQKMGVRSDAEIRRVIDEATQDPNRMTQLLEALPPSDRVPVLSALRAANPKGATIGVIAGQE